MEKVEKKAHPFPSMDNGSDGKCCSDCEKLWLNDVSTEKDRLEGKTIYNGDRCDKNPKLFNKRKETNYCDDDKCPYWVKRNN